MRVIRRAVAVAPFANVSSAVSGGYSPPVPFVIAPLSFVALRRCLDAFAVPSGIAPLPFVAGAVRPCDNTSANSFVIAPLSVIAPAVR
jgi:hypothetical protein